ncbi:hypothetical protein HY989_00485, partial [Candidatus Micrarchaeota archaeon]|nr:hypothetical protein [Candidatus Micrarchaeota archaeon]
SEEEGIVCGILEAKEAFFGLKIKVLKKDGQKIKRGNAILTIEGDIKQILRRERIALNYLQLLSGIATETRKLTDKVGIGKVAAMRKNHPLLAESEKRAVQIGGGITHRLNLMDGILIKDNHLDFLRRKFKLTETKAVEMAVEMALKERNKGKNKKMFVEVEVTNFSQAMAASKTKTDAILLDNMSPETVAKIAWEIRKTNKTAAIEASGGVTPENAKKYIDAGSDFVSMSYLAMKSKPLGMHLELASNRKN